MVNHSSWSERLKWAEEHGLKNLQEKFSTADNMAKEAQTTLTYVLAGMGGTFGYILSVAEKPVNTAMAGAIVLCIYFVVLGIYLAAKAFFISEYPSPYQQPKNLLARPDLSIDEVRHGELLNIEERLRETREWISKKALAVNRVRFALILSPLVFLLGAIIFKIYG
jgi:hypothetical protein